MIFFFSSRRRHTRFDCDWSSDVCSSDLLPLFELFHGVDSLELAEEMNRIAAEEGMQPRTLLEVNVAGEGRDRKSTRLNSSHSQISYAVFCLKKKKNKKKNQNIIRSRSRK